MVIDDIAVGIGNISITTFAARSHWNFRKMQANPIKSQNIVGLQFLKIFVKIMQSLADGCSPSYGVFLKGEIFKDRWG